MSLLGIWNQRTGMWVMLVNGEIIRSIHPEVMMAQLHNIRTNSSNPDDFGILSITGWANEAERQEFYEALENEVRIVDTYRDWQKDRSLGRSYEEFRKDMGLT